MLLLKPFFLKKNYINIYLKISKIKNNLKKIKKNFTNFFKFFFKNIYIYKFTNFLFFLYVNLLQHKQKFSKNKYLMLIFNFKNKQLFFSNFCLKKKKTLSSFSLGMLLAFLKIRIKHLKHSEKGLFLLLNFLKKLKFFINWKKNDNVYIYINSLKKKNAIFLKKLNSVMSNINISGFFIKPNIQYSNFKIKRFLKKRIKKKIIKQESIYVT